MAVCNSLESFIFQILDSQLFNYEMFNNYLPTSEITYLFNVDYCFEFPGFFENNNYTCYTLIFDSKIKEGIIF